MFDLVYGGNLKSVLRALDEISRAPLHSYTERMEEWEDEKGYHISLELPGCEKDKISIVQNDAVLVIKVEKSDTCRYSNYTRQFILPEGLQVSETEANYREGLLSIHIPKAPDKQFKRVPIK